MRPRPNNLNKFVHAFIIIHKSTHSSILRFLLTYLTVFPYFDINFINKPRITLRYNVTFTKLTDRVIKSDSSGKLVFFPYGRLGKGYTIDTKQQEVKVRRFMTIQWTVAFILVALFLISKIFALLFPFYFLQWYILKKGLLRTMQPSSMRFPAWDKRKRNHRDHLTKRN